jgi:hypothetical protein
VKSGPEELLPNPAAARCRLALDLLLNAHVMNEQCGIADSKADRQLARSISSARDARLLDRLARVMPLEKLLLPDREDAIDLFELSERLPFVYAMWVATTAGELMHHEKNLSAALEQAAPASQDAEPEGSPAP